MFDCTKREKQHEQIKLSWIHANKKSLPPGEGQNPARQASVKAGVPYNIPSTGVNMLCGSGLKAVAMGYQAIKAGDSKVVVAGGQESMSRVNVVIFC